MGGTEGKGADLLHHFEPLERVILTANGNLQRVVRSASYTVSCCLYILSWTNIITVNTLVYWLYYCLCAIFSKSVATTNL